MEKGTVYDSSFYDEIQAGSLASAREVVPIICEYLKPESVVDVGCGTGIWLSVFKDYGIKDVLGVDGDYVDKGMLWVAKDEFLRHDLERPLRLERKFDLVLSLEVAEHLPAESTDVFLNTLCGLGDVLVFSAAIPLQGGNRHLNEQWPKYWGDKLNERGLVAIDCLRRRIWTNEKVEPWYSQNMLFFVRKDRLDAYPELKRGHDENPDVLSLVHPRIYLERVSFRSRARRFMQSSLPRMGGNLSRWKKRRE